jgi:serine/threonine protein phosphatase PrpC
LTVLRSGSATDVGRVRAVNEDLALESATLYAVADGMGGHAGGEIASRVAIDALKAGFIRQPTVNGLVEAIEGANAAVWERGRDDPALRGMGTTMTAAALVGTDDGDRLVLANVGDSRTYRFHHGALEQLTTDHSVAEELVARGELSEAEAQYHPHRHILTRALGVSPAVDVDIWELEPQVGDRYLLCSDGLSNEVSAHRIETLLSTTADPQDASEALVHEANRAGGNDNITAVVLDVVLADDGPAGVAGAARAEDKGVVAPGTAPLSPAAAEQGAAVVSPSALVAKSTLSGKRSPRNVGDGSRRVRGPRRVTLRVLLFLVVLGAVAYGAWALIRWYVDGSYYVGLEQSQVVIFQGRPGGFVGLEPNTARLLGSATSLPTWSPGAGPRSTGPTTGCSTGPWR